MAMIGVLSSIMSFVFSGLDVLYTLFALNDLAVSPGEWSQIRAWRYALTAIIVLILGTYAGKIGQKRVAAVSIALMVVNLLAFTLWPNKWLLFVTMPLHAAFVSLVTMNINVLVQEVPRRLQSLSNTVYRSTFTGMALFGPLLIAVFAGADRIVMFLVFIAFLALCLPGFLYYPDRSESPPSERMTLSVMFSEWRQLLQNRHFVVYEALVTLIYSAFLANMVLGPVKLIQRLGMSDARFSMATAAISALAMLLMLAAGIRLQQYLVGMHFLPLLACSLLTFILGIQEHLVVSTAAYIAANALIPTTYAAVSIWTSRVVPSRQLGFSFAFHKILIAILGFGFSVLLSGLESRIGLNATFVWMGLLGALACVLLYREMRMHRRRAIASENYPMAT